MQASARKKRLDHQRKQTGQIELEEEDGQEGQNEDLKEVGDEKEHGQDDGEEEAEEAMHAEDDVQRQEQEGDEGAGKGAENAINPGRRLESCSNEYLSSPAEEETAETGPANHMGMMVADQTLEDENWSEGHQRAKDGEKAEEEE